MLATPSTFELCFAAMQLAVAVLQFRTEAWGDNMGYSKFAEGAKKVLEQPSRVVMTVIYAPAFVYLAAVALPAALSAGDTAAAATEPAATADNDNYNSRHLIVVLALLVHFSKRLAEVFFLHRYSGTADVVVGATIGCFYALAAFLVENRQAGVPDAVYAASPWTLPLGLLLFLLGELGNLHSHWRLAALRSTPLAAAATASSKKKKYVLPRGGMFELVTCPHYLFEIVAWLGVAVMASQLNVAANVVTMSGYLGGRSLATTRWYKKRFGNEFPAARRNLVPWVY